jgi:hypothetical protein
LRPERLLLDIVIAREMIHYEDVLAWVVNMVEKHNESVLIEPLILGEATNDRRS